MKLKLNYVESSGGSWEGIKEHGTLLSNLQKTDRISFSSKNLENEAKRVTLMIYTKAKDEPMMLPCSERLSRTVRKALKSQTKATVMRALLNLNVIENEDGQFFLIPAGTASESFTVGDLEDAEEVTFEELVAL